MSHHEKTYYLLITFVFFRKKDHWRCVFVRMSGVWGYWIFIWMMYSSLIGCMPRGPLDACRVALCRCGITQVIRHHLPELFYKIFPSLPVRTAGKKRLLAWFWHSIGQIVTIYVSLCVVQNALYFGKSSSEWLRSEGIISLTNKCWSFLPINIRIVFFLEVRNVEISCCQTNSDRGRCCPVNSCGCYWVQVFLWFCSVYRSMLQRASCTDRLSW